MKPKNKKTKNKKNTLNWELEHYFKVFSFNVIKIPNKTGLSMYSLSLKNFQKKTHKALRNRTASVIHPNVLVTLSWQGQKFTENPKNPFLQIPAINKNQKDSCAILNLYSQSDRNPQILVKTSLENLNGFSHLIMNFYPVWHTWFASK